MLPSERASTLQRTAGKSSPRRSSPGCLPGPGPLRDHPRGRTRLKAAAGAEATRGGGRDSPASRRARWSFRSSAKGRPPSARAAASSARSALGRRPAAGLDRKRRSGDPALTDDAILTERHMTGSTSGRGGGVAGGTLHHPEAASGSLLAASSPFPVQRPLEASAGSAAAHRHPPASLLSSSFVGPH